MYHQYYNLGTIVSVIFATSIKNSNWKMQFIDRCLFAGADLLSSSNYN